MRSGRTKTLTLYVGLAHADEGLAILSPGRLAPEAASTAIFYGRHLHSPRICISLSYPDAHISHSGQGSSKVTLETFRQLS